MKTISSFAIMAAFTFLMPGSLTAQIPHSCGTTEYMKKLIAEDPQILEEQKKLENFTKEFIAARRNSSAKTSGQVYIIPVVFHIIHENGSENISDAQVYDAIRVLNQDFRKLNADTTAIVAEFKGIAADCEIEFRLADRDPAGNCTNGIDRIYSHATNNADDESKLNPWEHTQYLNIWVVRTLSEPGVAAYAMFPASATGPRSKTDGIMTRYNYVGSIGTSNVYNSRVLTHEVGHYLNLYHVWGNTAVGTVCGDDEVEDTPMTIGYSGCSNLKPAVCDSTIVENIQNYMEYSYCCKMFTEGQKERMLAALNSSAGGRNYLWNPTNHVMTGINYPDTCEPKADFHANRNFICKGGSVTFLDDSWRAPVTSLNWTFTGGTPSTSTATNPVVVFDDLYWQNVTLTATGAKGSNTMFKENYVFVSPPYSDYSGTFYDSFEDQQKFKLQWFSVNPDANATQWKHTTTAAYSGTSSLMIRTYDPPTAYGLHNNKGDIDYLVSPAMDLSYMTSGTLSYRYSSATLTSNPNDITESLKVYYSVNCGQTWLFLDSLNRYKMISAGGWSTEFTPTSQSQWGLRTINLNANHFKPNVRFKIEYTGGTYNNNVYLDDINIDGVVSTGINAHNSFRFDIFPNPASEETAVIYRLAESSRVQIQLMDVLGKNVGMPVDELRSAGEHALKIDTSVLAEGTYWLKLTVDNGVPSTRKLIIVR